MRGLTYLSTLLLAAPVFSYSNNVLLHRAMQRRADLSHPKLAAIKDGRKVALVIDSSGSMVDTDPNNLRITAAEAINDALVAKAGAGSNTPDQVTVIDFDSTATVLYPLGDPSGADTEIAKIDSDGGTYIAGGIETGLDQLTGNGSGATANRTGMVVLTDGEDSLVSYLITQLERAQQLGVRVSFGFLSSELPVDANDLLTSILATGGVYSLMTTPESQQSFVNLVLNHGITDNDSGNNGGGAEQLLPNLAIAGTVAKKDGARSYTYDGLAKEGIQIAVQALSEQSFDVSLRDIKANKELQKASTGNGGSANFTLNLDKDTNIALAVSTSNATEGLFTVNLNSSDPLRNHTFVTLSGALPGASAVQGLLTAVTVSFLSVAASMLLL